MAGLCPIIVAQVRLTTRIEQCVYCLVPNEAARTDQSDRTVLSLPADGAASAGGRWSRRLGYSRSAIRLETADLSRGLGLELVAPDGSDWLLRLDPSVSASPTWTDLSTGLFASPSTLAEVPATSTVEIELITTDPAQFTVLKP